MRRSWLSIFTVYVPMIGVPVLLLLYVIFRELRVHVAEDAFIYLSAIGLLVFGIVSFRDVFIERSKPSSFLKLEESGERKEHARGLELAHTAGSRVVSVNVRRFNPATRMIEDNIYRVRADRFTSVLDALLDIKRKQDPTLSMRYSCRMGICGSCAMVVNGKPVLACETNLFQSAEEGEVSVSPMLGHPLLKDLVTDFDDFFSRHQSIMPHLVRKDTAEKYAAEKEYSQSREELSRYLPFSYCIMCGLCVDACPVVNVNPAFVGPQALSQVMRYYGDSRDQMGERRLEMIDSLNYVWDCEFAGACSAACPKGVDPAYAIQLLKTEIVRKDLRMK